jgi:hypothetical protein
MFDIDDLWLKHTGVGLKAKVERESIPPDFVIGNQDNPYLLRWRTVQPTKNNGGIYLHCILRDDDDRALHDHPWDFHSHIIQGSYREITSEDPEGTVYGPGTVRYVTAETLHRLVVVEGPVWTIVCMGKKRRDWGFQCPQGWIPWQEFVRTDDPRKIGRGCE